MPNNFKSLFSGSFLLSLIVRLLSCINLLSETAVSIWNMLQEFCGWSCSSLVKQSSHANLRRLSKSWPSSNSVSNNHVYGHELESRKLPNVYVLFLVVFMFCFLLLIVKKESNVREMGKKGSWFSAIKKVFTPHSKEKQLSNNNVRKFWILFTFDF